MTAFKTVAYTSLAALAAVGLLQSPVQAWRWGRCEQACQSVPACPQPPIETTVMVPQTVTEYRTKTVTRYRPETRERTVVVYRNVPTTRTIEEEYTVMVPETRTRTVVDTIKKPVYREIALRKTDLKPQIEVRRSTRTVCRPMPVQEERTVWESVNLSQAGDISSPIRPVVYRRPAAGEETDVLLPRATAAAPVGPSGIETSNACNPPACNSCNTGCTQLVPRKTTVTCMRPVSRQETVEYPLTSFKPDVQIQMVSYYEFDIRKVSREEQYVVDVPQRRIRTREVTEMQTVPEQKREQYTVLAPYQEQIQVPVSVVRCVPRRVTLPALPSCGACDGP